MNERNQQPEQYLDAAVSLVVAWRQGKGFDFGRVHTKEQFGAQLRATIDVIEARLATCERKPYAVGDEIETDEYMVAAIKPPPLAGKERPPQGQEPARPRAATTDNIPEFRRRLVSTGGMASVGASFLSKNKSISFYAIVRGVDVADRIAYIRHLNPLRLAKPGNIIATFGEALDRIEEPIFAMDDRIDLIVRASEIDVFDKDFFDGLFFGLSSQDEQMDGIVTTALQTLPMRAETQQMLLERSRGRKRDRRKMLEIKHSGHLANVTLEDFKRALAAYEYEEQRFIAPDGSIYADESDGPLLLEILNEDLFRGALTRRRFAATRKRVTER
ncbi:MAG: hypothetical protein KGM44_08700 [bacterium]|nr:hypothetical protein [bacterium]